MGECIGISKKSVALLLRVRPTSKAGDMVGGSAGPASTFAKSLAKNGDRN